MNETFIILVIIVIVMMFCICMTFIISSKSYMLNGGGLKYLFDSLKHNIDASIKSKEAKIKSIRSRLNTEYRYKDPPEGYIQRKRKFNKDWTDKEISDLYNSEKQTYIKQYENTVKEIDELSKRLKLIEGDYEDKLLKQYDLNKEIDEVINSVKDRIKIRKLTNYELSEFENKYSYLFYRNKPHKFQLKEVYEINKFSNALDLTEYGINQKSNEDIKTTIGFHGTKPQNVTNILLSNEIWASGNEAFGSGVYFSRFVGNNDSTGIIPSDYGKTINFNDFMNDTFNVNTSSYHTGVISLMCEIKCKNYIYSLPADVYKNNEWLISEERLKRKPWDVTEDEYQKFKEFSEAGLFKGHISDKNYDYDANMQNYGLNDISFIWAPRFIPVPPERKNEEFLDSNLAKNRDSIDEFCVKKTNDDPNYTINYLLVFVLI